MVVVVVEVAILVMKIGNTTTSNSTNREQMISFDQLNDFHSSSSSDHAYFAAFFMLFYSFEWIIANSVMTPIIFSFYLFLVVTFFQPRWSSHVGASNPWQRRFVKL